MTRTLLLAACCCVFHSAVGQDLVIANARIVDGTGAVIEQGSIVVSDGRIVSLAEGGADASGVRIDATGMTVILGLIDTHRHDVIGMGSMSSLGSDAEVISAIQRDAPASLATLLGEGFTTIMVPGGGLLVMQQTRALLARGEVAGPDVLFAGPIITAPGDHPAAGPVCQGAPYCGDTVSTQVDDPGAARAAVRARAARRTGATDCGTRARIRRCDWRVAFLEAECAP